MNCASCGAALPASAMFCGRCGRAVNAAPVPRARVIDPRPGDTTILIPSTLTVRQEPAVDAAEEARDGAGAADARGAAADAPQHDGDPAGYGRDAAGHDGEAPGPDGGTVVVEDTPGEDAEPPVRHADVPVRGTEQPVRNTEPPVRGTEPPVRNTEQPVRNTQLPDGAVGSTDRVGPSGSDVSAGIASAPNTVSESLIATRPAAIVTSGGDGGVAAGTTTRGGTAPESSAHQPPVPYVLSFSTGERVIVVGSGLLGRRPYVQPGESFDQLVSIADYERSVSKTHLEFGIEDGDLWICDRYSANGTVIIPPSGAPHRLEPGRRYRVPRAGRVEIGDRWFDVR